jgi:hypothetical protein
MDSDVNQLACEYEVRVEEIEAAMARIELIEKISYPNI